MAQCQARKKTCRKCGLRFTKEHSDMWDCPVCGETRRCQRKAVSGFNVCQVHGAGSPKQGRGLKPLPRDGLRTDHIPKRLLSVYEQMSSDDRLLSLRRDIELVELRINDLLTRVSTGESGDSWKKFKTAHSQLRKAYKMGDDDTVRAVMHDLGEVIKEGSSDYKAWDEIMNALDKRRKLVDAERKFMAEANTTISADKLLNMMIAVVRVINAVVQSERQRNLIQKGIEQLVIDYDPEQKTFGYKREALEVDYEGVLESKIRKAGVPEDVIERSRVKKGD